MDICKVLYGLKQSGTIAVNKLVVDLKPFGYFKVPKIDGLLRHESYPITFTLVLNNFGVKLFKEGRHRILISNPPSKLFYGHKLVRRQK